MARQGRMALQRRDIPEAGAFVCDPVLLTYAEGERRVVIEEEGRRVVVEAEEEDVGLLLGEPLRHRLVAFEERRPVGVLLLTLVERHCDRRNMRSPDSANDLCHAADSTFF